MYSTLDNFTGENKDIIEIVSSDTALRKLKNTGNNNLKVCLPLELYIGKLDSLTPFNRPFLKKINGEEKNYNFTEVFAKLKEYAKNCQKIRVWTSHLDADDYCLFLLICYLFKDKKISAIFSEELDWAATTLSCISEKEIPNLEKREHILKEYQKEDHYKEWLNIVKENKELRYMINGTVISCDIDRFDNDIIERIKEHKKIIKYELVASLMVDPVIPYIVYSDTIYFYLIERLEKKGIIKSTIIDNKEYLELNKND